MEEIKESMERCLEIISSYPEKLYVEEMYLSQRQWMLRISKNGILEKQQELLTDSMKGSGPSTT